MRTLDPNLQSILESGSYTPFFSVRIHDLLTDYVHAVLKPIGYELSDLSFTFTAQTPAFLDLQFFRTFVTFSRGVTLDGTDYFIDTSQFTIIDSHWDGNLQTFNCHLFPKAYYTAPGDRAFSEVITSFCEAFGFSAAFLQPAAAWLDWQFYPEGKTLTLNDAHQFFNILKQKYFIFATDNGNNEILFYTAFTHVPTNQYEITGYRYSVDYNVDVQRQYLWRDEDESIHRTIPTFKNVGTLGNETDIILTLKDIGNGIVLAGCMMPSNCKIFRSIDFGNTWDAGNDVTVLDPNISAVTSFVSPSPGIVLATVDGTGFLLRSTDYGITWQLITLAELGATNNLIDCENGIVLCSQNVPAGVHGASPVSNIYKSTDYGATWRRVGQVGNDQTVPAMIYLGNGYILVGTAPHGYIHRSTDYGEHFTYIGRLGSETSVLSLCSLGFGRVLAGTSPSGAIYISDNYGASWALDIALAGESAVYSIVTIGYQFILAGAYPSGKLYRSMDNGISWTSILTTGAGQIRSMLTLSNGTTLASTAYPALIFSSLNCAAETYPIHNLGFMPSQAVEPSAYSQLSPSKFDPFPVNLKYQSSDFIRINLVQGGVFDIFCAQVVESLDLDKKSLRWRMIINETQWLANTAVGSLPGTIERVAAYTPLVTANFNNNFDASINNLQAMADFLDDANFGGGTGGDVYTDVENIFTADQTIQGQLAVTAERSDTDAEETVYILVDGHFNITPQANSSSGFYALYGRVIAEPAEDTTAGEMVGAFGYVSFAGGTVNEATALRGRVESMGGTVNTAMGIEASITGEPEVGGSIDTFFGIQVYIDTGATIREAYGIGIGDITKGSEANYAIYTNAGKVFLGDSVEIVGNLKVGNDLTVTGNAGFFGHIAAAKPGAFTQTYSTASHTANNLTGAALTDNSGGTANTTLESIGSSYGQSAVRNNFADLAAMVNKDTADIANIKQVLNAVIDDLQSMGLLT